MANSYDPERFDDAKEFLERIRLSHNEWWNADDPNPQKEPAWVFRGMANARWNLLPTGLRPIDENSENPREQERMRLFERVTKLLAPNCNDFYNEQNKRLLWNCFIFEGIFQFINHLIKSGYRLENGSRWKSIFDTDFNFKNWENAHLSIEIHEIFCGLAQHHCIPTYLLDWTLNPLFAAYFACESWKKGDDIAIWAFCESKYRNYCKEVNDDTKHAFLLHGHNAILRPLPSSNQYLHAQQGVFTWVAGEYDRAANTVNISLHKIKWKGADEIIKDRGEIPKEYQFLKTFTLSEVQVPDLKELLYREGITRAALMPSLDNIALTVRSRW